MKGLRRLTFLNEKDSIKYRIWFERIPENKNQINRMYIMMYLLTKVLVVISVLIDLPDLTKGTYTALPIVYKFTIIKNF